MNIYSCWLPSIYDAEKHLFALAFRTGPSEHWTKKGAFVAVCRWQGSLIANRDDGFTFLFSLSMFCKRSWVHLILQNEYLLTGWTFTLEFNVVCARLAKRTESSREKTEGKKFIYRARKIVDTKRIYLPLETDEWMTSPSGWLDRTVGWERKRPSLTFA